MNDQNRFIVRRTDSQERFELLWKKRIEGTPTLKELAEMDEIINRDPIVQEFVLQELQNYNSQPDEDEHPTPPPATSLFKKLITKVRSIFKRVTILFTIEPEMAVN